MSPLRRRLAAFYRTQALLWDRYSQRYEPSGREVRALLGTQRQLRWSGGDLRGDLLPPLP